MSKKKTGAPEKSDRSKLEQAAEISGRVAEDFAALFELLDKPNKINIYQQSSFLALCDELNNIKSTLTGLSDGRPKPLDFSSDCAGQEKYCKDRESLEERALDLKTWAECFGPGHNEKASIAHRSFKLDELKLLQKWIGDVLAWHEKMKGKRFD